MSTLNVATLKSTTTSPPTVQNSAGTQIGTFCRAWVNFNGTSTVSIRAQFNVSSITDNAAGDYTVNFTTAMPDASYSTHTSGNMAFTIFVSSTASGYRYNTKQTNYANADYAEVYAAFFR